MNIIYRNIMQVALIPRSLLIYFFSENVNTISDKSNFPNELKSKYHR